MKSRILVAAALAVMAGVAFAQVARPTQLNRNRNLNRGNAKAQEGEPERPATTREDIKNAKRGTNGVPALAFNQADVSLVLEAYADELGKTVIPAPDLPKAQITLRSLEGQTLTKEEYLEAIEVVLTMNGVVIEPRGEKFLRALPRKTVRTHGIPVLMSEKGKLPEQGRVVSQMIQFKNIEVSEAQKALEGFKAPEGLFQVFERTNAILVTDTQENINRMLEIARAIDVATPVLEDVFVRQVEYALATDIKTHLETIVQESQKETQQKQSGPKQSGAPGFGSSSPSPLRTGLLNLNNRPGIHRQQQPENKPNANLIAAVSDADRGMIRGKVLILADERSNKLIIITSKSNMDFFDKVIKTLDVETTPEVQIDVIRLKYAEAEDVEQMLNDLIGASSGSSQNKNNQNANTQRGGAANSNLTRGTAQTPTHRPSSSNSPTFQNANASRLGELNKDNVKVLADKRINGIVVMARKADMKAIREVIDNMDVKLSQVLIETVIIEITLGDDLKTGIDWVQQGRQRVSSAQQVQNSLGQNMYYMQRTTTRSDNGASSTEILGTMVPEGYSATSTTTTDDDGISWTTTEEASTVPVMKQVTQLLKGGLVNNGNYMLGGGGGDSSATMETMLNVGTNAAQAMAWGGANPIGAGVNYLLKSDKLNLAAVIDASKTDTRSKYIASPIVMTVDNKEATIDATENRQFLTGWTAQSSGVNGGGMPSPNYSAKDIGIKIKVTPKINPNGTVMLTVEEEYSQYVKDGQQMLLPSGTTYAKGYVDLAVERKMSADVRLENMQTVVFGGLTETSTAESETGIPILKDIPWVGKWLFGKVTQSEARKELLVFMTPYVLDDEQAAQLEALRRKKALSDPRPWDDHGWSASPLADPVSKKEQLRRFNEEWNKQDEERKTKLAIEKAKVERARKLEKMSKEEREFWLELHKDELEKEKKEAFEKEVKEQEDLKGFVENLKRKDLENAEKEIKKANDAAVSDNQYNTFIKDRQKEGQPLPAGETLNRDAEAIRKAEAEKQAAEAKPIEPKPEEKPAEANPEAKKEQ